MLFFSPRRTAVAPNNGRSRSRLRRSNNITTTLLLLPCIEARREKRLQMALLQEDPDAVVQILTAHPEWAVRDVLGRDTALERLLTFRNPPSLEIIQAVGDLMMVKIEHPRFLRKACESERGVAPGVMSYLSQKCDRRACKAGAGPYYFRRHGFYQHLREPIHIYLTRKNGLLEQPRLELYVVEELLEAFPHCLDETSMSLAFLNRYCPTSILELMVNRCIEQGTYVVLSVHKSYRFLPMDTERVNLLLHLAAHNQVQCGSQMFTDQSWLYFLECLEDGRKLQALELKVFGFRDDSVTEKTWSTLLRLLRTNSVHLKQLELRNKNLILDRSELFFALRGNSTLQQLYLFSDLSRRDCFVLEETLRNHHFSLTEVTIFTGKHGKKTRSHTAVSHFLKLNKQGRAKLIQDGFTTKDLVELLLQVRSRSRIDKCHKDAESESRLVTCCTDTQYGLLRELPALWAH